MIWLVLTAAVVLSALLVMGVHLASRRLATSREHDDQPGVQSAVTFQLRKGETPLAELLDAVHGALESAGADASTFSARGVGFELDGMLGADAFRVTLARIDLDEADEDALPSSHDGFLLLLHARTLGRYRYVAPPDSETTRTLLRAIDRALRGAASVHGVEWRSRQASAPGLDATD